VALFNALKLVKKNITDCQQERVNQVKEETLELTRNVVEMLMG
jgi:hypothetical protein